MLKSLEIKASIRELNQEIEAGVNQNIDMSAKAAELASLMASYDKAVADENKRKNIKESNTQMTTKELRAKFNKNLKALLMGRPMAEDEQAPDATPEVVTPAGNDATPVATGSGNYPTDGNNSAYLIPEAQLAELAINEGIVDLAQLATRVAVSAPTGKYPVIDYSQKIELVDFVNDNETEITKKSAAFTQDTYTLGTRGVIVPIARELMQDASVDIVAIIHNLLGRTKIRTQNADIIAAVTASGIPTATQAISGVAAIDKIKEIVISTLPITYQANAKILMNQKTFAKLANIKDKQDHYIMQPDITLGGKYAIANKEIVVCENEELADDKIVVGDFRMVKLFERVGYEVMSDVSAGFKTNSILVRAIARYVVKNQYKNAFVVIN